MSDILKEFGEVLKKHLPEQTAGLLRERLDLCDELEKENAKQKGLLENYELQVANLRKERTELYDKVKAFEERERDVQNKELWNTQEQARLERDKLHLKETVLEIKLAEAEKRSDQTITLVNSLFRNTEYRREVFNNNRKYINEMDGEYNSNTGRFEKKVTGESNDTHTTTTETKE